jgi:2-dehydropantoate 2-reductase
MDHGDRLAALRNAGLRLTEADGKTRLIREFTATDDAAECDTPDCVILGVKAHEIPDVLDTLHTLIGEHTTLVTIQNGLPWWYFQRHGGRFDGTRLHSLDPDGAIAGSIDPACIIGCVAYPAAEAPGPGRVRHVEGDRFPLGELDGRHTQRVAVLSELFQRAGFRSPVLDDIRSEIWLKAWGNLAFNPVSALTRMTMAEICRYAPTRQLVTQMMTESAAIADRLGIRFRVPMERRLAGAERVGHHKTSMLQDVEAGRKLEIDAVLGSVIELGRLTGKPVRTLATVHALVRALEESIASGAIQPAGGA